MKGHLDFIQSGKCFLARLRSTLHSSQSEDDESQQDFASVSEACAGESPRTFPPQGNK